MRHREFQERYWRTLLTLHPRTRDAIRVAGVSRACAYQWLRELGLKPASITPPPEPIPFEQLQRPLFDLLREQDRLMLVQGLHASGSVMALSRTMGIDRSGIHRRMRRLGVLSRADRKPYGGNAAWQALGA